jgi:hypothetical protein
MAPVMPTSNRCLVPLVPHASSRGTAVDRVQAHVDRTHDGRIFLAFEVRGQPQRLVISRPGRVAPGRDLWQHTCGEVFIAREGEGAYWEYNLATSRQWAAFAFSSYRQGGPLDAPELAPMIDVRQDDERLHLAAAIDLKRLAPTLARAPLQLGLAMVLEEDGGELSHWALTHATTQPDFHHSVTFALGLPALT